MRAIDDRQFWISIVSHCMVAVGFSYFLGIDWKLMTAQLSSAGILDPYGHRLMGIVRLRTAAFTVVWEMQGGVLHSSLTHQER